MYDVPFIVWFLVLAGISGYSVASCVTIGRGAMAAGTHRASAIRVALAAGGVILAWLALAWYLALQEVFPANEDGVLVWLPVSVAGALTIFLLGSRVPAVRVALAVSDRTGWMVDPHAFRALPGIALLVMLALGELPALFALPAGLGAVGIAAVALVLMGRARRGTVSRSVLKWFIALSIVDLSIPPLLGFLTQPDPMPLLPLVLIPTGTVPLALALHIVSLRNLTRSVSPAPQSVPAGSHSA